MLHAMRRFRPPWTVEDHNDACFIVRDKDGQALGYFYFEDEPVGARRPSCSPGTRPAAWRRTSPGCRSWCGGRTESVASVVFLAGAGRLGRAATDIEVTPEMPAVGIQVLNEHHLALADAVLDESYSRKLVTA